MPELKRHKPTENRFDRIELGVGIYWEWKSLTDDSLDQLRDRYPNTYAVYFTPAKGQKSDDNQLPPPPTIKRD